MAARQYTVGEITRMRLAVQELGKQSPIAMDGQVIEAQLRTYMDNGTAPDELDEAAWPKPAEVEGAPA